MQTQPFVAFVLFEQNVAVNDIKPLSVAKEAQQWFHFALLSSYKIYSTAVHSINVLSS